MIGYGTSGRSHDFFVFNLSGSVWDGAEFVTWLDANYASYRISATETGSSGRFTANDISGASYYDMRERGATLSLSYIVWSDDVFLAELQKIPRAASALIGGAAFTRNLVTDTEIALTEYYE